MTVRPKRKRFCALIIAAALCLPTNLTALAQNPPEEPEKPAVCTCEGLCAEGSINTDCPVCAADISQCLGANEQEQEPEEPAVCTCEGLCAEGAINTQCPVCAADIAQCLGENEQEQEPEEPAVCTCDGLCTEGSINTECPVCAENAGLCTGQAPLYDPEDLPKEAFAGEPLTAQANAEPRMLMRSAAANSTVHSQKEIAAKWQALDGGNLLSQEISYQSAPVLTSAATLVAGELSQDSQLNGLNYLNIARYIAGVGTGTLDPQKSEYAQYASTYMAFGGTSYFSHTPAQITGVSNTFYDSAAKGAKNSNIAYLYGSKANMAKTIQMYLSDSDTSNIQRVGHRRWLLYPGGKTFGFGLTKVGSSIFSATYVQGGSVTTTQNVMWPAQQMPVQMFDKSDAWSLSLGSGFSGPSAASVKVTLKRQGDGHVWTFSQGSADGAFYVDYYPGSYRGTRDAIIFRPNNISYAPGDIFDVKVEGLSGSATYYAYTVEFFDITNPQLDPLKTPAVSLAADSVNGGLTCTVTDTVNSAADVASYTVEIYQGSTLVKTLSNVAAGSATKIPVESGKIAAGTAYTARVKAVAAASSDYSDSEYSTMCAAAVAAAEAMQTVTFNAGAGTVTEGSKSYPRKAGSKYTGLPVPSREGYKFAGWFTAADGAGTQITETTAVSADETRTLYAKWNEKTVPSVSLTVQTPDYVPEGNAFAIRSAVPATGYTVTYRPAGTGAYTATLPVNAGSWDVKISREEDDDYKAFEQVISGGLSIGKADHADVSPAMTVRSNTAGSLSFDLASIEGGLPAGYTFTTPVYQGNDDGLLIETPYVLGTFLHYSSDAKAPDTTGTIRVAVNSTNYETFDILLTVTSADKETVTIDVSGMSVGNKVYDGAPAVLTGAPALAPAGKVDADDLLYAYTSTDGKGYSSASLPTDAGAYQLIVSVPADNPDYKGTSSAVTFSISKRNISEVTIGQVSGSFTYNKAPHTPSVTISDMQGGKELIAASDYDIAYNNNIHAGTAKITVTPKDTGNYTGEPVERSFTIGQCPVTVGLKEPFSKPYDGNTGTGTLEFTASAGVLEGESLSAITASGCVLTDANAADSIDIDISRAVVAVTAGENTNAGDYAVRLSDGMKGAVTPKNVTAAIIGPDTAVYGTAFVHSASYSDISGNSVSLDVLYDAAKTAPTDVKGTRIMPASYALTAQKATADGNYSITGFTGTTAFTITPKAMDVTQIPKTLRFNDTSAQKVLFTEITDQEISTGTAYTAQSALLADNSLQVGADGVVFELADGLGVADVGTQITITVPFTPVSQNYQAGNGVIVVTLSDKTSVDDKLSVSLDGITYGDAPTQPKGTYSDTAVGTPVWKYQYTGKQANGDVYGPAEAQPKYAGVYTVTAVYEDDAAVGRCAVQFNILPKALEWDFSGLTVSDKTYNGTDTAAVTGTLKLAGVVPADQTKVNLLSYSLDVHFADALVATGKQVTVRPQTAIVGYGNLAANYNIAKLDEAGKLTASILAPTAPVALGNDRTKLAVDTIENAYATYPSGISSTCANAGAIKDALKLEAEKTLSSVGDRIAFYDVEVETSADGITWQKTNGGAKILIPYPAGTSAETAFDVVHMKDEGTFEHPTLTMGTYGVEFTLSSTSPLALAWKDGSSSGSDNPGGNTEDEQEFWQSVKEAIENAEGAQTIQAPAKDFDKMPENVMEALRDKPNVSLEITWNGGDKIVIPAGAAIPAEPGRSNYPLSYLETYYKNLSGRQGSSNPVTSAKSTPDAHHAQEKSVGICSEAETRSNGMPAAVAAVAAALAAVAFLLFKRKKVRE